MNQPTEVTIPETTAPLDSPPVPPDHGKSNRRSHGKIAQLPKVLRVQVNTLLDEGVPYAEIVEKLQQSKDPPLPFPISKMNISRWKDTGYRRYLAHNDHLACLSINRQTALEMVAKDDTITLPEATLQIIASQYYEFMGDFSPDSLREKLAEDPLKYTRFLNVFARLTREILLLQKHREASAQAAAAIKRLDPNRQFNEKERDLALKRVEDLFHIKLPRASPADPERHGETDY